MDEHVLNSFLKNEVITYNQLEKSARSGRLVKINMNNKL